MNQKSILIICDLFPPAFGPRMGYLCKYLLFNGWKPVVLTEDVKEDTFAFLATCLQENEVAVTRVRYYNQKGWRGKMEWGWTMIRDMLFGYKDNRMYREAIKIAKNQSFDRVLCSTYRTFPIRAAARFAHEKRLPLVVDLRDIIEQYTGYEFITHPLPKFCGLDKRIASIFRKRNLAIRNNILRKATAVTTVSPWHVSILKIYNVNTHLIYNGYDPDLFYPSDRQTAQFYITYTGRLLSTAMRDPDLLFKAVNRLSQEGIIDPDMFRIRWFVDEKSAKIITREAAKYPHIIPYMGYYGYIPASEIPQTLHESAILLLLTNKSSTHNPQNAMTMTTSHHDAITTPTGPQGVMTTKLFESLAVGRPILCVRGDEGCLEAVINQTRSGLSAHHTDEVYDFIKHHFLRWKAGLPYEDISDKNEIKKYSREAQAKEFIEVFEQAEIIAT